MNTPPAHQVPAQARETLRLHGPGWWRAGRADLLDAACRPVPPESLAEWPEVAYWRALAALMRGSAEALPCLEQAHAGYDAAQDASGRAVSAHAALVLCLLDVGAMDQVSTWLERARAAGWPSPLGNDTEGLWLRLGVLARVVLGGDVLPEAGLAAAWVQAQLRPLRTQLSPDERLIAAQVLVNYHFVQQQYEQFDMLSTQVEAPDAFEAASPLMRGHWLYTVGFAHYQIGGHARAEQAWRQALDLAQAHTLPSVRLLATLAMVRLLVDRGRIDEAHAAVEGIRPQWGAGRTRQLVEWQQMRARVQLMRGQAVQALATLREALSLADASGLSAPEQASFLTDQAQIFAALGRDAEACELLQQLAARHAGRDAEVYTCLRLLLQAWLDHRRDEAASRTALADALARAQAVRYTMFLRLLPERAAQLCALALRWHIEPVFVREVVRDRALPAPADADAQWPWPLWLRLLGGFAITLGGSPLEQQGKTPHKPLELLRLLACERSQAASMLSVQEALWPDADDGAARKNLEMAIQRLRRLLGDDSLVRVGDGRVALDAARVSSDLAQRRVLIERLEAQAMQGGGSAAPSEMAALVARVIDACQGELLPGVPPAPWLEAERQRCQRDVVRATQSAATLMARFGDQRAERELLERAVRLEPLAEGLARRLMQVHAQSGQRAEAVRVYEALARALSARGLQPSAPTDALWREIVSIRT
ncbi:MAG TPA: BTAD domain-containing putative transcriptional regulator [Rhizobacter sp.]|nr:BTAD domain-containing putative transcriptional regulator [Rhizobacter sp.]